MKAQKTLVNQRVKGLFAGWGERLVGQPQVPTLRSFILGLAALVMVIVGMRRVRAALWLDVLILVGGGVMLWLWLLQRMPNVQNPVVLSARLYLPRRWLGGLLALGAVGMGIWGWRTLDIERPTVGDWQWYVATIGVLLVAALVMERWQSSQVRLHAGVSGWLLIGIVAVGALVRLVNLDSLPFGTWYDEAANGLEALRMVREVDYQPIFTDGVNSVGQYLWLIVGAFKLFGETTLAVRSISAMMGIATVLAAYWAGRELHGHSAGMVWAFLFAVARWSITFSRLGMYNSATPLFELLALAWFLRGLRRGSVLDFTLAGIAVGLGMSFYYAFQLFLVAFAIFGLVVAWQERANWRTLWAGVAIGVLAVLLVIGPLVKYVTAKPESYFSRVQTTSLFTGKAPEERLPALLSNASKHLLMFNVRGDPNGRHNLPGEPMLDWVSGGLMVVGLATCLRRGVDPRYLIAPVWLAVGLLGGILSLDFEAPQSLRTIGALPAALLCAALPVSILAREWRSGAGRYAPSGGLWILGAVLLLPAGVLNLHTYFVRQAGDFASWNAHSTPETIAAQVLREADPDLQKYVISLFDGHPTVRFLAGGVNYQRVETNAMLPLLGEMPGGMMLVVDAERQELYQEARRIYATGNFQEVRPPFGGPAVVYVAELRPEDLQSVQGLRGTYGRAEDDVVEVRKDLTIDFQWPTDAPVEAPFVAEWQGVLATNSYGPYQFFVQAPGEVTLRIGESVVLEGDASQPEGLGGGIVLARGNHTIHFSASDNGGGEGRVRLAWQPPDGPPATIPSWALYVPPVQSNGLLGEYFANGNWEGEPAFAQIDPHLSIYFHVPTLARPYSVEWRGKIAIPEAGDYDFALRSIDESVLLIDGTEIATSKVRNEIGEGGATLAAGLHDIRVRYVDRTDHTYINLMWRPPGLDQSYRVIPTELLYPPQENYDLVDVTDLARFVALDSELPAVVVSDQVDQSSVEVVASGLVAPHGVAVVGETVYVAETGRGRVVAIERATGEVREVPLGEFEVVEPFDLAADADGGLVVLDAATGQLLRVDPATGDITLIPVLPAYVERSRGVGHSPTGDVWIANTPGKRVAAVDANGEIVHEIALPPMAVGGQAMQPVDVVVAPDQSVYVTDVGRHMLYRFGLAGYLVSSLPIPQANAMDGAHLAIDDAGLLYMTEPESGRVVRLDANGTIDRVWNVRVAEAADAKPVGIAVAADGTIWVVDSQGGRLLRVTPVDDE